uniref:Uncharacterized protein n=1 Tax=Rhizophora mucronata TaxID=61149 RepID=A0A2P2PHA3_RHIMU
MVSELVFQALLAVQVADLALMI